MRYVAYTEMREAIVPAENVLETIEYIEMGQLRCSCLSQEMFI